MVQASRELSRWRAEVSRLLRRTSSYIVVLEVAQMETMESKRPRGTLVESSRRHSGCQDIIERGYQVSSFKFQVQVTKTASRRSRRMSTVSSRRPEVIQEAKTGVNLDVIQEAQTDVNSTILTSRGSPRCHRGHLDLIWRAINHYECLDKFEDVQKTLGK